MANETFHYGRGILFRPNVCLCYMLDSAVCESICFFPLSSLFHITFKVYLTLLVFYFISVQFRLVFLFSCFEAIQIVKALQLN